MQNLRAVIQLLRKLYEHFNQGPSAHKILISLPERNRGEKKSGIPDLQIGVPDFFLKRSEAGLRRALNFVTRDTSRVCFEKGRPFRFFFSAVGVVEKEKKCG